VSSQTHVTAAARLRAAGQRYTSNRRALVEVLAAAGQPVSIREILDLRRDLPQSSAYRNLALLEQAGVVHRVVGGDEFARFELAEDLTEHHHHLICSSCGAVADFSVPAGVERTIRRAMDRVASGAGFAPHSHRLDVIGLCARCG
jgi:Fe2+ or Zn2+ uptake regulation protein